MYLILDELRIENKHLTRVFFDSDANLRFYGLALDMDGKEICTSLSKFKKGQIIEVGAETYNYHIHEGICEIVEIDIPPAEYVDKGPVIFRFSGELKQVF